MQRDGDSQSVIETSWSLGVYIEHYITIEAARCYQKQVPDKYKSTSPRTQPHL